MPWPKGGTRTSFKSQEKLKILKCLTCKEEFKTYNGKYCSIECAKPAMGGRGENHYTKKIAKQNRMTIICKKCSIVFNAQKYKNREFCSYKCSNSSRSLESRMRVASKAAITNRQKGNYEKISQRMKNGGAINALKSNLRTSKPQRKLYEIIKAIHPEAQLEYNIENVAFADIAIPSFKVDIEYDGAHWHKNPEKDKQRDIKLAKLGWRTFRFTKKDLTRMEA